MTDFPPGAPFPNTFVISESVRDLEMDAQKERETYRVRDREIERDRETERQREET